MTVYEANTTLTVSGGSANALTLRIPGGMANYLLIRANTSTTVFRADLTDENSIIRLNYDFHTTEIVDDKLNFPMTGRYTINITNASPNDTFRIILAVAER